MNLQLILTWLSFVLLHVCAYLTDHSSDEDDFDPTNSPTESNRYHNNVFDSPSSIKTVKFMKSGVMRQGSISFQKKTHQIVINQQPRHDQSQFILHSQSELMLTPEALIPKELNSV